MSKFFLIVIGTIAVSFLTIVGAVWVAKQQIKSHYLALEGDLMLSPLVKSSKSSFQDGLFSLRAISNVEIGISWDPQNAYSNLEATTDFNFIPGYHKGLYLLKATTAIAPINETKSFLESSLTEIPDFKAELVYFIVGNKKFKLNLGAVSVKGVDEPILAHGLSITSSIDSKKDGYLAIKIPEINLYASVDKIQGRNLYAAFQLNTRMGMTEGKTRFGFDNFVLQNSNSVLELIKGSMSLDISNLESPYDNESFVLVSKENELSIENFIKDLMEHSKNLNIKISNKLDKLVEKTEHHSEKSISGFYDFLTIQRNDKRLAIGYKSKIDQFINVKRDLNLGKSFINLRLDHLETEHLPVLNRTVLNPSSWAFHDLGSDFYADLTLSIDGGQAKANGYLKRISAQNAIPAFQSEPLYTAGFRTTTNERLIKSIPEALRHLFESNRENFTMTFEFKDGLAFLNNDPMEIPGYTRVSLLSH